MQHEHLHVPVTALSLWHRNVVLSGEGNFLKAYDLTRKTLLAACQVFESQAIHGIIHSADTDESYVLVWGGQLLRLIFPTRHESGSISLSQGNLEEAQDWILDAAFSLPEHGNNPRAVLVTAHNALLIARPSSLDMNIRSLVPDSNCILYSAHASWLSTSKCLIASGTAFGNIMIWTCTIFEEGDSLTTENQMHYAFSAHEGSVFGLHLAPVSIAAALGQRSYVLASCSDDRTVRIWDISDLTLRTASLAETEQATGFCHHSESHANAPPLIGKAMGHLSRIWHVRFCQQLTHANECHLVTFGEDATIITWRVEAGADRTAPPYLVINPQHAERAHSGKNLWAISLSHDLRTVTGGADGAITWRDLAIPDQAIEVETTMPAHTTRSDYYRAYGFIGPSQVVATTHHGRVLLLELLKPSTVVRKELSAPLDCLRGYSILTSHADLAFFAGIGGVVYSYRHGDTSFREIFKTGRKVAGLFAQSQPDSLDVFGKNYAVLATNVGAPAATLCFINLNHGLSRTGNSSKCCLSLPNGFIVTSFASFQTASGVIVILGSRNGLLSIFSLSQESTTGYPVAALSAHRGETVTCLQPATHCEHEGSVMLFSTGRDGTYAAHLLRILANDKVSLSTIHQVSLPLGPNIEGIGYAPGGHLTVWAFRSKEFVAFDINNQRETMTVECGGAHRTWSFQMSNECDMFVWTKASKLYWKTQEELPFQSLNAGGHGREIKSAAVSPMNPRLIATGAEDTNIKLSLYDGSFRCLHTLQNHNTGIQHLQWSSNGKFLFSSGGFEEFFVWRLTDNLLGLNIGVICESKNPRSGTSDLRITKFDVRQEADVFQITMVYSDSSMRVWRYADQSWVLLATSDYLTAVCLTQCVHLNDTANILTAATDGYLAIWKRNLDNGDLRWDTRHRIHQNAILCMIVHDPRPDCRIVLTGGDDNAIGITTVSGSTDFQSLIVPKAHAAAVTAIAIVHSSPGRLWFVSVSLDQRAKLWRLGIDLDRPGIEGIAIRLMRNVFTAVADASSIDKVHTADGESGVLICGVGMHTWRVDTGMI